MRQSVRDERVEPLPYVQSEQSRLQKIWQKQWQMKNPRYTANGFNLRVGVQESSAAFRNSLDLPRANLRYETSSNEETVNIVSDKQLSQFDAMKEQQNTIYDAPTDSHFNIKVGNRQFMPKAIDVSKIGLKRKRYRMTANTLRRTEQPFTSTFDVKAKKTTDKSEGHLKSESQENLSVGPF